MITDRILEGRGRRFAFREAGDSASPAVFLLHAMGPDATDWDAVAEGLAEDFRVIALHQRGFGPSTRVGAYSFELMRDDVLTLADLLGLQEFALVGHSMGGTVGYLVAEVAPERVRKLVVEDTPPPWGSDMADPPAEPPQPVPFDWEAWKAIARELKYPSPRWWDELPEIACPTLIIGGGATSHVPQELLVRVSNLIPDCRLETFEGAGHNVHAARPAEYLAMVREFLAD
jgi:pimeloyl-ACP methyl ester carboxylesterase